MGGARNYSPSTLFRNFLDSFIAVLLISAAGRSRIINNRNIESERCGLYEREIIPIYDGTIRIRPVQPFFDASGPCFLCDFRFRGAGLLPGRACLPDLRVFSNAFQEYLQAQSGKQQISSV